MSARRSRKQPSPQSERAKDVRPKTDLQRDIDPYYITSIDALRAVFDIYTSHFNTEVITSYMMSQTLEAVVPGTQPFVKEEVQAKLMHFSSAGQAGFNEFVDLVRHAQRISRLSNKDICVNCEKEVGRMRLKRDLLVNKALLGTESDAINAALGLSYARRRPGEAGSDNKGDDEEDEQGPAVAVTSINEGLIASLADREAAIAEKDALIAKLNAQLSEYRPKLNAVETELKAVVDPPAEVVTAAAKKVKGKKSAVSTEQAKPSRSQQLLIRGGRSREEVLETARQLAAEAWSASSARHHHHPNQSIADADAEPEGSYLHPTSRQFVDEVPMGNGYSLEMSSSGQYRTAATSGVNSSFHQQHYFTSPSAPQQQSYNTQRNAYVQLQSVSYPGSSFSHVTDTLLPSMPLITEEDVQQILFDRRPQSEKLRSAPSLQTVASSTAASLATSEVVRMNGAYHALDLERRMTQTNVKYLPIHGCHRTSAAAVSGSSASYWTGNNNLGGTPTKQLEQQQYPGDSPLRVARGTNVVNVSGGGGGGGKASRSNPLAPQMMFGSSSRAALPTSSASQLGGTFDLVSANDVRAQVAFETR